MSVRAMQKYIALYESLDAVRSVDGWRSGAFLLGGEDEDGLNALARVIAARLCSLSVDSVFEEHADIIVYPRPAEQKKSKSKGKGDAAAKSAVSVDDIREITDSLYLTPFELPGRVYIIENAESMSEVCQNKLLKSLEEPPARVCFILCASGRLLPTVESRCNRIELAPFDDAVTLAALEKVHGKSDAVTLAARACRGNIGMAENIIADPDFADTYAAAKKLLSLATGSRMFARTAAVYEKYSREKADAVLDITEYLLCDVARLIIGSCTVFDERDVSSFASGFTAYAAAKCCDHVRTAKKELGANCMPQSVMDGFILKIMEERALCQM